MKKWGICWALAGALTVQGCGGGSSNNAPDSALTSDAPGSTKLDSALSTDSVALVDSAGSGDSVHSLDAVTGVDASTPDSPILSDLAVASDGAGGAGGTGTGGATVDSGSTGGTPGSGGAGAAGHDGPVASGGQVGPDASQVADAPTQDAPAGTEKIDGAIASCIRAIRGGYVLRVDGVVVLPATTNPQIIVEASTALPLTGATAVQGGTYHGCAALSNGTVECWQTNTTSGNSNGQLGNGTTTASSVVYRATPVLKSANTPLTGVVAFATGGETTNGLHSTCAVTSDGKLWCWGDLTWIVNGGTTLYTGYAQAITTDGINALAGVVQAAYTLTGACALIEGSPRTVWCWGYNASDELGQGNTTNQQYAVKVLGLTAPSQVIISNSYYSDNTPCALDGDGVKCWGNNGNATAGINATTNPVHSPTPVVLSSGTPLSGVVDLEPGTAAIGALRTDGTLWTWGYGFKSYATNYGLTNIVAVGYVGGYGGNGPRFLTSDGVYHNGSSTVPVQCTP